LETIQGAAGFLVPDDDYLIKLKKRCEEVGALLILDEIQPGFGEQENCSHLNISGC
jgi:acetylornithine/succinyldiaminopimelate/putrescine aminotransferase